MLMKCKCETCQNEIEFDSENGGQRVICPACQFETQLPISQFTPAPQFNTAASAPISFTPPKKYASLGWKLWLPIIFGVVILLIVTSFYFPSFAVILGAIVGCLVGLGFYFLPSMIGNQKRNAGAIFMLNLFLGWTLLGWVIALVWACTKDNDGSK